MDGDANCKPLSVEDVFTDFKGRRAGLIKALTTDAEEFYQHCDPEKENLCLYGLPNEQWEVKLPVEEVPPELPEPTLGINFVRDQMQEKDWLTLVALRSDFWLTAVAFFFGTRFGFDKADRNHLFDKINELPTLVDVVTGAAKEQVKDKSKTKSKVGKNSKVQAKYEDEGLDEEEENDENLCGTCGEFNGADEFWIFCDVCERWFHGKCVNITPARAEHIKKYKCPTCSNKRARPWNAQ
ncbi:PHD finger protein ALFIN-LIKE 5 [Forsythia ovata]|uniref:PHD finger protein ALFIN-LIKE n=1 Tax=Forsythia ovata TaxID=205694 RepID=A0ABD1WWG9_9LAMI